MAITEHTFASDRHTTRYLACGPTEGPLIIFVHGWPELSQSWRHQLPFFGGMGFRAIAPDMRGYGGSTVYDTHEAYEQRHAVEDMLELLAHLDADRAIWVGHDLGAPVVWNLASHHPEGFCLASANNLPQVMPSAPIPIPTSRWRKTSGSCAKCWKRCSSCLIR